MPPIRQVPPMAGLELAEVELPDLVRPRRRHHERGPAGFGELAPFGLVVDRQHPAGALQGPQDGRVGAWSPSTRISIAIVLRCPQAGKRSA